MPIERDGYLAGKDKRDMAIHHPGSYVQVLRKVCEQDADGHGCVLAAANRAEWEQVLRERAELTESLIAQRSGQPVLAQSYQLPSGLPAPFKRFTPGEHRSFSVTPDDQIHLLPRRVA